MPLFVESNMQFYIVLMVFRMIIRASAVLIENVLLKLRIPGSGNFYTLMPFNDPPPIKPIPNN